MHVHVNGHAQNVHGHHLHDDRGSENVHCDRGSENDHHLQMDNADKFHRRQ